MSENDTKQSIAQVEALAARIVASCVERNGALELTADGEQAIAGAIVDAVVSHGVDATLTTILTCAMFIDTEKKSPDVAQRLVDMARRLGALVGAVTAEAVDRRAQKFKQQIAGDDASPKPLDSGVRPANTTAASPMARFLLAKDDPKTKR